MHQYKQEFGEGFELGFELSRFPYLKDKSWHNDVCPSFIFKLMFKVKVSSDYSGLELNKSQESEQYLVLWADYLNVDDRENPGSSRYTVITATASRFSTSEWDIEVEHDEDSITLFESEDPDALAQFLEQYRLPTLTTLDITT